MAFAASAGLHTLPPLVSTNQLRISSRITTLIQAMMKGVSTATVSPDSGIPPAGASATSNRPGIGSRLDLTA